MTDIKELSKHILMPYTSTYAERVYTLREACKAEGNSVHPTFTQEDGSKIFRPLTLKGNLEAKVTDYETLKNPDGSKRTKLERLELFNNGLDSCTGIVNKKKSTKFKVVPVCRELILIDRNFYQFFLPVDYDSVDEPELDSSKGNYNVGLTEAQLLEQPGWRTVAEEDLTLLKTVRAIWRTAIYEGLTAFHIGGHWIGNCGYVPKKLMGFCVESGTDEDRLRALHINNQGNASVVRGCNILDGDGSFLRVAQETP